MALSRRWLHESKASNVLSILSVDLHCLAVAGRGLHLLYHLLDAYRFVPFLNVGQMGHWLYFNFFQARAETITSGYASLT